MEHDEYTIPFEKYIEKSIKSIQQDAELNKANKKLVLDYIQDYVETNYLKLPTHLAKLRRWHKILRTPVFKTNSIKQILKKDEVRSIKNSFRELREIAKSRGLVLYDYRKEVKCFFKWLNIELNDNDQYPKCVRWIKNPKKDNEITPEKILSPEDVEKLVDCAKNIRDKALIFTLFESTCRANEFLQLKIGSVIRDEHGIQLRIKQGKKSKGVIQYRRVRLMKSVHYLNLYLESHPYKEDTNAPLWVCIGNGPNKKYTGTQLKYSVLRDLVRNLGKQAGFKKRVHAQLFRISILTEYAKFLPESLVKKMGGHAQDSRAVRQYYKISDNDVDVALLGSYGVEVDSKKHDRKQRTCGRCHKINPLNFEFCGSCGFPLSQERMEQVAETQSLISQAMKKIMDGSLTRRDFEKVAGMLGNQ